MQTLEKNEMWDIVELPKMKKIEGCKWIVTIKKKADEAMERCKARLTDKGFKQTYGIDYQETLALVAKMNTFVFCCLQLLILIGPCNNLMWSMSFYMVT